MARGSKVNFDLQTFLSEMRAETKADHVTVLSKIEDVDRKIDGVKETSDEHETRLVVVEGTRKTLRWLAGTLVVAILGGMADFFFIHLPRMLK